MLQLSLAVMYRRSLAEQRFKPRGALLTEEGGQATSERCPESNSPRSATVLTCQWFLSATPVKAVQLEVTGEKNWWL